MWLHTLCTAVVMSGSLRLLITTLTTLVTYDLVLLYQYWLQWKGINTTTSWYLKHPSLMTTSIWSFDHSTPCILQVSNVSPREILQVELQCECYPHPNNCMPQCGGWRISLASRWMWSYCSSASGQRFRTVPMLPPGTLQLSYPTLHYWFGRHIDLSTLGTSPALQSTHSPSAKGFTSTWGMYATMWVPDSPLDMSCILWIITLAVKLDKLAVKTDSSPPYFSLWVLPWGCVMVHVSTILLMHNCVLLCRNWLMLCGVLATGCVCT